MSKRIMLPPGDDNREKSATAGSLADSMQHLYLTAEQFFEYVKEFQ
ncbi:MAG: hypothetical protein ACLQVG_09900 [Terriglobia bacterium]